MEDIQMTINEQIRLIHEDQDKFIFEIIRTYTDGVLAHEGIIKIPKKLLERAITCFKMEHPAEFELLLNGDEGMKQKIVEGNKSFHCGIEESGFHAYNCNDCPNKCEEYYQWDKEMRGDKNVKEDS